MEKFKIRFVNVAGKAMYLHNGGANAAIETFDNINDVVRNVRILLACGNSEVTVERFDMKGGK